MESRSNGSRCEIETLNEVKSLFLVFILGSLHLSELGIGRAIYMDKLKQAWPVFSNDVITVLAGQLKHRIPSFGYVFEESTKPGKLNSQKLAQLGIPKGSFVKLCF